VQEVVYQSLLQPTRQHYHERIVQVLTTRFPETAETQPELIAHHATAAGWSVQAIASWQRAGEMALARSAHVEATTHFRRGLELLMTLPETPERAQTELALQRALSTALLLTRGFAAPEVAQVYGRARALCEQVGDHAQRFPVLFGLRGFYEVRGELQTAWELGEQLLTVAQHEPDATCLLQAHRTLGDTAFWLGEFGLARAHLEQAIALHDPQQHATATFRDGQDHGIVSRAFLPRVLWVQGYPEQALARSLEVLTLVHDRSHPFDLAVALNVAAMIHQLRRESAAVRAQAEALLALCQEQHFALYGATGTVQRGWALVVQGQPAEGSAQILAGLEAYRATGAVLIQPYFLALLAQAYAEAGQTAEGLRVLEEALTLVHKTGERFYEAEIYRLQGDLVLAHAARRYAEAQALYQQALATARRQQASSWELRAAISLSRLWQRQGKRAEAYDLLAPVYGWFTEGFDTADLQEAKTLLDELVENRS
jgi:predicted ATPase